MKRVCAGIACAAAAFVVSVHAHAQAPPAASTLNVALVVRVRGPALLTPDGQPAPAGQAALPGIEHALRWLERTKVPFALSASPVWVDELVAAGQTGTYAALLSVATRHVLLHAPYAYALLPAEGGKDAIHDDLATGERAIERSLQTASQRILDPPGLALSDTVIDAAHASGLDAALAPVGVVGDHPVSYRGTTLIPVADSAVTSPADVYGTAASLVVVAYAGADLETTVGRLAADKRVRLVNITDLSARVSRAGVRFEPSASPPSSYRQALRRARGAVSGFASYTLPGNQTAHLLNVLLGRAESTADWQSDWKPGIARASAIVDAADAGHLLVSASDGSVTLTSRRGAVPVTLENGALYPVRVRVRVTSPKLTFPSGDERIVTISPHGVTIAFVAVARSTGSFPMDVSLESPDSTVHFNGGRVVVRSTAANVLALLLTGSGLLFLIVWSSRDFLRRTLRRRTS